MLAPRPIRLPSKRRDLTPVRAPVRAVAATTRPRNFRARLPLVPRARRQPRRGLNSSLLIEGVRQRALGLRQVDRKRGAEGVARGLS